MFLILFCINWPNVIVWLRLILEILGNMFFLFVCFPGCVVINFEFNLIFLIKPFSNLIFLVKQFSYMIKKSRQKLKYYESKKNF